MKNILIALVLLFAIAAGIFIFIGTNNLDNENSENITEQNSDDQIGTETQPQNQEQTAAVVEVNLEAYNYGYSEPEIHARVGDTIRVRLIGVSGMHDFVIDELGVHSNMIEEGQETIVEFTVTEPGTFEYYCSMGNHRAQGMFGMLMVEE